MKRKKALITGASHGIGKAIAIALAQNGYDVGVNYCNNRTGAEDTCRLAHEAGAQALAFRADVGDYQALRGLFDAYFDAFGSIDLMVNNAGVSEFHQLLEVRLEGRLFRHAVCRPQNGRTGYSRRHYQHRLQSCGRMLSRGKHLRAEQSRCGYLLPQCGDGTGSA